MVVPEAEVTPDAKLVGALKEALKTEGVTLDALQTLINPPASDDGTQTPEKLLVTLLQQIAAGKKTTVRLPAGDPNKGTGDTPDGSEPLSEESLTAMLEAKQISGNDPRVREFMRRKFGKGSMNAPVKTT